MSPSQNPTKAPPPITNTKPLPNISLASCIRRSQLHQPHRHYRHPKSKLVHARVQALKVKRVGPKPGSGPRPPASHSRLRKHLAASRHPATPAHKSTKPVSRHRTHDTKKHHPHTRPLARALIKPAGNSKTVNPRTQPWSTARKGRDPEDAPGIKWHHWHKVWASRMRQARKWVITHSSYRKRSRTTPSTLSFSAEFDAPVDDKWRPCSPLPNPYVSDDVAHELMAYFGADKYGPRRHAELLSKEAMKLLRLMQNDLGSDVEWAKEMHRKGAFGGTGVNSWGGEMIKELEDLERADVSWNGEGLGVGGLEQVWGARAAIEMNGVRENGREGARGGTIEPKAMAVEEDDDEPLWTVGESDLEDDWDELISVKDGEEDGDMDLD